MVDQIQDQQTNELAVWLWKDADVTHSPEWLGELNNYAWQGISQSMGDFEPFYVPSRTKRGGSEIGGFNDSAEEAWEAEFLENLHAEGKNTVYRMKEEKCRVNFLLTFGLCGDPGDPDDWIWAILAEFARLTEMEIAEMMTFESQKTNIETTGSVSGLQQNRILKLPINPISALAATEVVDLIFADDPDCGDCGPASNGHEKMFFALENDGVSEPPKILYRVKQSDGEYFEDTVDITSWAIADQPSAIARFGKYIIVLSETDLSHAYALHADFKVSSAPTPVVKTGYTTAKGPRAIWVKSARKAIVVGAGGYVYKLTGVATAPVILNAGVTTTNNLNAVDGMGSYIIAVGASNTIIFSQNDGASFSLITGPAVGVALTGVKMRSRYAWEIITADGKHFFTADGGDSWKETELPHAFTGLKSLRYSPVSDEVGVMVGNDATDGYVLATVMGGRYWHMNGARIEQFSTKPDVLNAAAISGLNHILAGGVLSTAGVIGYGTNN